MTIYQHFRKEEHLFIDQVLSWKEIVETTYQVRLTDFLDPREQEIIMMLIGKTNDIRFKIFGGGEYTERKRLILAPFYEDIIEEDLQVSLMQASFQKKFNSITHRDVMGAFLSLGIKRQKLGDIFIENGIIQMIVAQEVAAYVMANLTKIKNATINWKDKDFSFLLEKPTDWVESNQTVSSLRLDSVTKEIYNMSRKEAMNHIEKGLVKVNFKQVEDKKFNLIEGDMISIRGKGRSKLITYHGKTKKNKLRITTAILK